MAFYYLPATSSLGLSSSVAFFMATAMLLFVFAGPTPKVSRARVLIFTAVIVALFAAKAVFAADGIPLVCDTMPWWTVEYFLYCYMGR